MARGMTQFERWRQQAVKRLAAEPFLVASALAAYQRRHHLDADAIATWLGCSTGALQDLALCAQLNPTSPRFEAEVACLAGWLGCDAGRLADLLAAISRPPRSATARQRVRTSKRLRTVHG